MKYKILTSQNSSQKEIDIMLRFYSNLLQEQCKNIDIIII